MFTSHTTSRASGSRRASPAPPPRPWPPPSVKPAPLQRASHQLPDQARVVDDDESCHSLITLSAGERHLGVVRERPGVTPTFTQRRPSPPRGRSRPLLPRGQATDPGPSSMSGGFAGVAPRDLDDRQRVGGRGDERRRSGRQDRGATGKPRPPPRAGARPPRARRPRRRGTPRRPARRSRRRPCHAPSTRSSSSARARCRARARRGRRCRCPGRARPASSRPYGAHRTPCRNVASMSSRKRGASTNIVAYATW